MNNDCIHLWGQTKELGEGHRFYPKNLEELRDRLRTTPLDLRFVYCPICGKKLDWSWVDK